jgi:hypothetical protein
MNTLDVKRDNTSEKMLERKDEKEKQMKEKYFHWKSN